MCQSGKEGMPAADSAGFEYFFKACRIGDAASKAVTVGDSAFSRLFLSSLHQSGHLAMDFPN